MPGGEEVVLVSQCSRYEVHSLVSSRGTALLLSLALLEAVVKAVVLVGATLSSSVLSSLSLSLDMPLSLPVLSSKSFSPATRRPLTLCNLHCNCSSDAVATADADDSKEGLVGVDSVSDRSGFAVISVANIE